MFLSLFFLTKHVYIFSIYPIKILTKHNPVDWFPRATTKMKVNQAYNIPFMFLYISNGKLLPTRNCQKQDLCKAS